MKFGILKSKIETLLSESYSKKTFKQELSNFKKNVLDNKNISKLYYLYDDLSSNKGLNESIVDTYINESISTYNKISNRIKPSELENLKNWVGSIKTTNQYSHIDDLFSDNILTIESRINSKKTISESLKKKPVVQKEIAKVPISSMVSIANRTITDYIGNLTESDKQELFNLLSQDDEELTKNFEPLKESVITKLTSLKRDNTDYETGNRITETISKIESEKYDKLTYFKLKGLNENL
jgi:hypothetical protein